MNITENIIYNLKAHFHVNEHSLWLRKYAHVLKIVYDLLSNVILNYVLLYRFAKGV
jgi:hypothetical protein